MTDDLIFLLTLLAALGCGLIAGVFFAFSAFVMKALARITPGTGLAAMQSINVVALNVWFLGAFFGTAAACAGAVVASALVWHRADAIYLLSGGTLYLLGTFGVTLVFNVPRNRVLASVTAADPHSAGLWREYVRGWTGWNHVRTAASLAGAVSFSLALAA
jgi:uncharacterized membrane protein